MTIQQTHTALKSLIKEYMRLTKLKEGRGYLCADEKELRNKVKRQLERMVGEECKQLTIV